MTITDLINTWLEPALADWFWKQCRDPYAHYYLYYKPAQDGQHGALCIAEDAPNENWKLATPQRVDPTRSPNENHQTLFDACGRLPILGETK